MKLNRVTNPEDAEVYVKLEFFNPGSSVKDRIALAMVEAAEKEGKLKRGWYNYRTNKWEHWYWSCNDCCCKRIQGSTSNARNNEFRAS